MKRNKSMVSLATALVIVIVAIGLVSCSQGVPVDDARNMQEEIHSIANRVSLIESTLMELKDDVPETNAAETQIVLDDLINELREISIRMAEIEAKLDFPDPDQSSPEMDSGIPGGTPAPGM